MILSTLALVMTEKASHAITLGPRALVQLGWLLALVIVYWIAVCFVAWWQRRLLVWLGVSMFGYPLALVLLLASVPLGSVAMVAWYASLVALPGWWMYRGIRYGTARG
jgi:hypothetical protein